MRMRTERLTGVLTADSFDTAAHSQATAEEACGKTADFLEKG